MFFVGLDIGFGETKTVVLGDKELRSSFPSLIAEPTPSALQEKKLEISFGGKRYVIGRDARTEPGCFQLYDFEDLVRYSPLITEYVFAANNIESNEEVFLCISCPPSGWQERKRLLEGVKSTHTNTVILPQGYGAFYAISGDLPVDPDTALVLDFGYNTVDWLVMERQEEKWQAVRGDTLARMGVMKLVGYFRSQLKKGWAELPERVVRELLRKGKGRIYGEEIELEGEKRRAVEQYREMLLQALKGVLGEIWREVDVVVCAGGGTYYFSPKDTLPHSLVVIPDFPEFANAQGQALWVKDKVNG